ncbi:MAG: methyltransferase domain-containing protein [Desulfobacterales bacterium]|jgi:SAM-dependent methyltransferase
MCNTSGIAFSVKNLSIEEIRGKRIVEVGACDVNGSLRPIIESWGSPAQYIGVDIEKGPGVDVVCNAENIIDVFGTDSFDIVIATELLEHIHNWRKVISNIKNVCKTNGAILITTRSKGFKYHGYPYDFWRYELDDLKEIFSDYEIIALENDPISPGVFLKAKKPYEFVENNLKIYKLYSVVVDQRVAELKDLDLRIFLFLRERLSKRYKRLQRFLFRIIRSVISKNS